MVESEDVRELFPLDGSAAPRRLTNLPAGVSIGEYRLSADGRWLVFRANLSALQRFESWRLALDGSERRSRAERGSTRR
ncbi:MAG: hypothetical protein EXS08_02115 [Planctomycetes bacterium]|nr:hypothetical protein [Planctomycetota bacterium]